jgi:hypothetical protein
VVVQLRSERGKEAFRPRARGGYLSSAQPRTREGHPAMCHSAADPNVRIGVLDDDIL